MAESSFPLFSFFARCLRGGNSGGIGRGIRTKHTQNKNMNHISISFAGDYRPLHIESQEMADCVKSAIARCDDESIAGDIKRLWVDWQRHAQTGLSCASLAADASRYSVVMRRGQRDPWLDGLTGKFPQNPQIKY